MDTQAFQNIQTVAQQTATSTATQFATSVESKLTSTASQFTGALNSLGAGLANAGQSLKGAASSALDQMGSFSSVSKFVDKLVAPKKIQDIRPEGARGRLNNSNADILQFPLDLGNYFIRFTFASYYRDRPLVPKKSLPQKTIFLPIPSDLNDRFGVQYADKPLGAFGLLQESGLIQDAAQNNFDAQSLNKVGKRIGQTAGQPGNLAAIIGSATGMSDTSLGTAVHRAAGAILNPYQALTFQGVELRSHSFKWKCSPNSEAEAAALKAIILEFKQRMLPEKSGLLLNFPDVCTIEFSSRNMPYSFKNCYLKSMSCNYAPSGTPAFFKGGKYPAEVEISLDFGEIEPVYRNDLGTNGNLTGNVGEAYSKPSGMPIPSNPIASDPGRSVPSKSTPKAVPKASGPQSLGEIATGQKSPLAVNGMDFGNLSG